MLQILCSGMLSCADRTSGFSSFLLFRRRLKPPLGRDIESLVVVPKTGLCSGFVLVTQSCEDESFKVICGRSNVFC
jgi:hypothetical protein